MPFVYVVCAILWHKLINRVEGDNLINENFINTLEYARVKTCLFSIHLNDIENTAKRF